MKSEQEIRALIIEDNPGDVLLLRKMLAAGRLASFAVEVAENLTDGLAMLDAGGFQVLLLDLGLPESTGLATLKTVLAGKHDLPVIVLTGLSDEGIGLQAVHEGAQDFLGKGRFDAQLLERAILYAMERKALGLEREKLLRELQEALIQVKILSGFLPICSFCKKIRDDKGNWSQMEVYISARSGAKFSHGLCPDCYRKHYPDIYEEKHGE